MFTPEANKLKEETLPEGYEIITEGILIPGDVRWNRWHDQWNLDDVTQSPKHDCIIGDPVYTFAGVCRKKHTRIGFFDSFK